MDPDKCKEMGGRWDDNECKIKGSNPLPPRHIESYGKRFALKFNRKCLLWMIPLAIAILVGGAFAYYYIYFSGETGTLELRITDLPMEDIKSLEVEISDISVHYAGDENNSEEWISVKKGKQTFNLMDLVDSDALLAEKDLRVGQYTQIRLSVDEATLILADDSEHELTIPSKVIKITNNFVIVADGDLTITLDFEADKSVHLLGNGKYQMRPTIKAIYG